jgi:uncharacterized membrane protein
MKKFFAQNIESRGRVVRGILGGALVIGGMVVCHYNTWAAVVMILAGGFCLFEAVRGWCVMRACGVRTKM